MKLLKKEKQQLDMRSYIQYHLDLYGLGQLESVKGPRRGGASNNQSWWELVIKYRPPGNEHREDVQFYDKYIEVYLGLSRKGGYFNRRNIRVAIEKEARRVQEENIVDTVWSRAQLSLTTGKNESGAIEL